MGRGDRVRWEGVRGGWGKRGERGQGWWMGKHEEYDLTC